ncbi:NAD(P)-dependent oxidoreductase [Flavihumibacter sp. UBA7668]|uniref:NAD(P)-dependent oxidoreductase n=1 Tax=Flavihumibacter sp. UBA7668 TaxID=1946542 RepID=UPI0025BA33B6|nr:SDR family oxidoreductase [Flavihumibacter sp. UBA7668]
MKLVIFGATGQVGKYLVQQGLLMGHQVRAFGRNVHELPDENHLLEKIKGAVFDPGEVFSALQGTDAVLSALGGSFDGTDKTRSLGIKNIITQMKAAGVKRIVALGGAGILDHPEGGLAIDHESYPPEYVPVGREHQKAWEALRDSGLDWTFVCSPDIINAEVSGKFLTAVNQLPEGGKGTINAGDLALCMLQELDKNSHLRERIGISNV